MFVYAFDVDGVLTPIRSSWQFVKRALGIDSRFDKYAQLFFDGLIAYDEWVWLELRFLKGVSLETFRRILNSIPWRHDIEKLAEFRRSRPRDVFVAITGGFALLCERAVKELGFDACIGAEVEVVNGRLTGFARNYIDFHGKGTALRDFIEERGLKPAKIICVGDNINDLDMFKQCDVSIAFCPSEMVGKSHVDVYIPSCSIRKLVEALKAVSGL